jgi:hypothetical protein
MVLVRGPFFSPHIDKFHNKLASPASLGYIGGMKKLLALLPITLILLGCPPYGYLHRVYYDSPGTYTGALPVDTREYQTGETAVILGQGTLSRGEDYTFEGWNTYLHSQLYKAGDEITMDSDFWFTAVWKYLGEDYKFELNEAKTEATITEYVNPSSEYSYKLALPDVLGGLPVTAIAEGVFDRMWVSELTLPIHLKSIGFQAFSNNNLSSVAIPGSVAGIGAFAFENNCLSTLDLGSGLAGIGPYAFRNNSLRDVAIPAGVASIGEGAFQGNDITVIEIGANVDIKDERSMGSKGKSFRSFYAEKGKASGLYKYSGGTWQRYIPSP